MSIRAFWVSLSYFDQQLLPYLAPDHTPLGVRVEVPFGNKTCMGIGICWADCDLESSKLKPIIAVDDQVLLYTDHMKHLAHCIRQYYHSPLNQVLQTFFSPYLKPEWSPKPCDLFDLTEEIHTTVTQSQAQKIAKVGRLKWVTPYELLQHGISTKSLDSWRTKGWLLPSQETFSLNTAIHTLNPHQLNAFAQLKLTGFGVHLLQGITGSGKTEVYLHAMLKVLQQGKRVLMMVPEIGLTPQTHRRLAEAIHCPVVMIHSQINPQLRGYLWSLLQTNTPMIVLGTRSSVMTDIPNLGLIIIDEEHDASFVHDQGNHYDARHVALFRAKHLDIPVIMGSATPSLQAMDNAKNGKYHWITLEQRHHQPMPSLSVIDCRGHRLSNGLAPATQSLLVDLVKRQKQQVLLFLNRRGYAPVTLCHECGFHQQCPDCDAHMTYHQAKNALICHHCQRHMPFQETCPQCQQTSIINVGVGTEQLALACQHLLPDATIVRIDRDTAQRSNQLDKLTQSIISGEANILIGTQMIAKGHDFPFLNHVIMVDIDQGFYASDYRANEHLAQMVMQVSGRCGRHQQPGSVYLQTYVPHHPMIAMLIKHQYTPIAEYLLAERQQYHLPPYSHHASITAKARHVDDVLDALKRLIPYLNHPQVQCFVPVPLVGVKRKGEYRYQLLITSAHRSSLHQALNQLPELSRRRSKVTTWITVDPISG